MERLDRAGRWWVPGVDPRKAVGGLLKYEPDDGLTLELLDKLPRVSDQPDDLLSEADEKIVLGVTHEEGAVTLVDVARHSRHRRYTPWLAEQEEWRAGVAFLGTHFDQADSVLFDTATLELDVLPVLVNWHPFDSEILGEQLTQITVRWSEPGQAEAHWQGWKIVLSQALAHFTEEAHSVVLSDVPRIEITTSGAKPLGDFQSEVLGPLQDLISLLAGRPSLVTSLTMFAPRADGQAEGARRTPIRVLLPASGSSKVVADPLRSKLFGFGETTADLDFAARVPRWLDLVRSDELRTVIQQYSTVQAAPPRFVELRFLTLVSALEDYHRVRKTSTQMAPPEFDARVQKILEACRGAGLPQETRWLKGKLERANDPSLEQRLGELIRAVGPALSHLVGRPDTLAALAAGTRNYLSHRARSLEGRAAATDSLVWLEKTLRLLVAALLLLELGVAPEDVESAIHLDPDSTWIRKNTANEGWAQGRTPQILGRSVSLRDWHDGSPR